MASNQCCRLGLGFSDQVWISFQYMFNVFFFIGSSGKTLFPDDAPIKDLGERSQPDEEWVSGAQPPENFYRICAPIKIFKR